jgi:hypothetical protein
MSSQGSPIEKQGNYLKHSELSVLSVLKLAAYSEQINNWTKGYSMLHCWPTNMS